MKLPTRPRPPAAPAVLVAVAALALGGCSQLATMGPGVGPLLSVERRGGECPAGACSTTVVLERDGRIHQAAKPPDDLGVVSPATVAALDAAIRATDFAALRSHPFTGECPTAYDGQEIVFEFGAPGGTQRIASCEVEIDVGSPLFVAVAGALGSLFTLPID